MDLLISTKGRLGPRPFLLGLAVVYVAGLLAQLLLVPEVTARAGLAPFIVAQALLIGAWLVLHIRRLRDAGEGPTGAIAIALIYALALGLLLTLIAFLTNPNAVGPPAEGEPAGRTAASLLLVLPIFGLLFSPDFGVFMTILKILVLIACLPVIVSLIFSIRAAMRPSQP